MSQLYVGLVIIGGGCAGLSLAIYLSETHEWKQRTVIIEPRATYENDRSWCFWEPSTQILRQALAPLIRHRWEQWRFSGADFTTLQSAAGRRYCFIAAEDFYRRAVDAIEANPYLDLWRGRAVARVEKHPQGFLLTLSDGTALLAGKVIDTRPSSALEQQQARLWQIFYGYEIKTSAPFFDKATVGLMEHLSEKSSATQFIYTLPFSATHALVELTQFTAEKIPSAALEPALKEHLNQRIGWDGYTIWRSEQGTLPMGLCHVQRSQRSNYHYAGIGAGAIRPATGYAFIRIQRWALTTANLLVKGERLPIASYDSALLNILDTIFLRVLHDTPALGAAFFQALAQKVPGPALVRFLMDEATLSDYWCVMHALPAPRFLAYALGLNRFVYPKSVEG